MAVLDYFPMPACSPNSEVARRVDWLNEIHTRFKVIEIHRNAHKSGKCNGKCYYCWLENMTIGQRLWKWLAA